MISPVLTNQKKIAHLCYLPALVVPSQQCDVGWEAGFEEHEHGEDFQTVVSSVYKVSHEDVVCQRDLPTSLKQSQQVVELSVDVAAYLRHIHPPGHDTYLRQSNDANQQESNSFAKVMFVIVAQLNIQSTQYRPLRETEDAREVAGACVKTHRYWCIHWLHIRLLHQDLLDLGTE